MDITGSPQGEGNIANGIDEEWSGFEETDSDSQPIPIGATKKPQQEIEGRERGKSKAKRVAQTDVLTREKEGNKGLGEATFEALYDQVEEEADGRHTT